MPEPDFVGLFTEPLEKLGLPYMITGATGAILYGQPRLTNDLDLVLELPASDIGRFHAAFPVADFYIPPVEVIGVEVTRSQRGHFNVIHHGSGYKADIYTVGLDPLHHWAFPLRRRLGHGTGEISVAPPEYVILRKLEYFREGGSAKHPSDIKTILQANGDSLDWAALHSWANRLGLDEIWKRVQADTRYS
jgi:hypothetical protein